MARGTSRRRWLILVVCAAGAAAVLTVGLPGSGAGADRGRAACGAASHGMRLGWLRGHDPTHLHGNESQCPPAVPAAAPSDPAPNVPMPSLTRIPAARTALTLSADRSAPRPPTGPAPRATTSTHEQQHVVEVAPHAAATASSSPVLTGAVFAFMLAVSGIVFAAGRRGGRRQR